MGWPLLTCGHVYLLLRGKGLSLKGPKGQNQKILLRVAILQKVTRVYYRLLPQDLCATIVLSAVLTPPHCVLLEGGVLTDGSMLTLQYQAHGRFSILTEGKVK
jgi:hypothetical protein